MTIDTERCPRCSQPVRPGAAFCTLCGAPLSNRAARVERNVDHDLAAALGEHRGPGGEDPGRIAVASGLVGPERPAGHKGFTGPEVPARQARPERPEGRQGDPEHGGGTRMTTRLELVPASAGKRLGAAVLDWLGPIIVLTAALAIGFAGIRATRSNGFIVYDTGLLVLLGGLAAGATLVYVVVLASVEARSGNTIGNQFMGIRSTDTDGYAPGGGTVLLRGLFTGGGLLLAGLASGLVLAFGWFAIAVWVLVPLVLVAAAWAVVVVVSNSWDANGKLRGWHDKAANSLMFDVKEGRNPVASGGVQGPYSFAPIDLPPVQQVASPVAGAPARTPHNPNQWQPPAMPAPTQRPTTALGASGAGMTPQAPHPDDDLDRTQLRSGNRTPSAAVLRIRIDDGQDIELGSHALLGRNPEGQAGELIGTLVPVADPGRSISKTHLHLKPENDGVWITDRNSTNGSAVTTPDGLQTRLPPGQPVFVRPGSTVHFGDRTFYVGQA